jgi:hypothetical protein
MEIEGESLETTILPDEEVQSLIRAYPKMSVHIFDDGIDRIVAQTRFLLRLIPENIHRIAIETVQTIIRAYPDKALLVLENGVGRYMTEPLSYPKVDEPFI